MRVPPVQVVVPTSNAVHPILPAPVSVSKVP
jgi:hypothetical protein